MRKESGKDVQSGEGRVLKMYRRTENTNDNQSLRSFSTFDEPINKYNNHRSGCWISNMSESWDMSNNRTFSKRWTRRTQKNKIPRLRMICSKIHISITECTIWWPPSVISVSSFLQHKRGTSTVSLLFCSHACTLYIPHTFPACARV